MSYICYATKEPVEPGTPQSLVPLILRKVNYMIYKVTQRGNNLHKQFMNSTQGYETVLEVPVNPKLAKEFRDKNAVEYLPDEKNIYIEYSPQNIKSDVKQKLEVSGNVIVNNQLANNDVDEVKFNSFSDLARHYNDDDD